MFVIEKEDIDRIKGFVEYNNLSYVPVDDGIGKFHLISYDNIRFYFYRLNDNYIVSMYNPEKDIVDKPSSIAYEYYEFKNLLQVLEQLKYYDDNLEKTHYTTILNSAEIGFDENNYKEDWYEFFLRDVEFSMIVGNEEKYKYLVYENKNKKPILKNPNNTLYQVSDINHEQESYISVNKLYFEIHPISCEKNNEQYLFKLLANNEEVLKDYINYIAYRKEGLNELIKDIFQNTK